MKLAISNIGWTAQEEPEIAEILQQLGVKYVEIAPTKVWKDPTNVTDEQIADYKAFWAKHGIEIVAFQSMLFGRLDLTIFDDQQVRAQTQIYLDKFMELAGRIGAEVLVFGSPKNRRVPEGMEPDRVMEIAKQFFGSLGDAATKNNTHFCIEPNPVVYDCNFVTEAAQGRDLVEATGNRGFRLHLDAAGMTLADDPASEIIKSKGVLQHFHISAPYLGLIEEETVDHQAMADALQSIEYDNFVSIEMRPGDEGENAERVRKAVAIAQKYYL